MAEPVSTTAMQTLAIPAAKWAWDHQDEIEPRLRGFYRTVRRRIKGPDPRILVLGAGGTGKTTLGKILSGKYDYLFDVDAGYEQSIGLQTFRSKKAPHTELVVAPGQVDRRNAEWPGLLARFGQGKESGIIHCCCYGYHALTISYKKHKLFASHGDGGFLEAFLKDRRSEEVRILESLIPAIEQNAKPTWLLTYVSKEDLWCGNEQDVLDFYTTGPYGKLIRDLAVRKGNRFFRHELVLGASTIRSFVTGKGECLQLNTAGYDHSLQVRSLRSLIETVFELNKWKAI